MLALLAIVQAVIWAVEAALANNFPLALAYLLGAAFLGWLGVKLLKQSRKKDHS